MRRIPRRLAALRISRRSRPAILPPHLPRAGQNNEGTVKNWKLKEPVEWSSEKPTKKDQGISGFKQAYNESTLDQDETEEEEGSEEEEEEGSEEEEEEEEESEEGEGDEGGDGQLVEEVTRGFSLTPEQLEDLQGIIRAKQGNIIFNRVMQSVAKDILTLLIFIPSCVDEYIALLREGKSGDPLVRGFMIPTGIDKKSVKIFLTPYDKVEIFGGVDNDGTFFHREWQLPQHINYERAGIQPYFKDETLYIIVTNYERKTGRIIQ